MRGALIHQLHFGEFLDTKHLSHYALGTKLYRCPRPTTAPTSTSGIATSRSTRRPRCGGRSCWRSRRPSTSCSATFDRCSTSAAARGRGCRTSARCGRASATSASIRARMSCGSSGARATSAARRSASCRRCKLTEQVRPRRLLRRTALRAGRGDQGGDPRDRAALRRGRLSRSAHEGRRHHRRSGRADRASGLVVPESLRRAPASYTSRPIPGSERRCSRSGLALGASKLPGMTAPPHQT